MKQAITTMRTDVDAWFSQAKANALAFLQWSGVVAKAVLIAMFVPSKADKQIEESRERARRYLMHS